LHQYDVVILKNRHVNCLIRNYNSIDIGD